MGGDLCLMALFLPLFSAAGAQIGEQEASLPVKERDGCYGLCSAVTDIAKRKGGGGGGDAEPRLSKTQLPWRLAGWYEG